ncbi:MAG: hypothetical protein L0F86_00075 [Lactococcus lactis]|nr:hypothetical protein [Lactococcus lactis]MDN5473472.1 hypothetical protein [Lactococcus lactis]
MKFYLQIDGKRLLLPVNPSEIKIKKQSNNSSNEVVALGSITQLGSDGLEELSIESFFPKDKNSKFIDSASEFFSPDVFISTLKDAQSKGNRVRLTVTESKINILTTVEAFDHSIKDASGDYYYTLELKQYREFNARYVTTVKKKVSEAKKIPVRPAPVTQTITTGCRVICNGQLHRDSYGSGPGVVEKNAERVVNFIAQGRAFPYHVTLLNGGWRGWVTAGSVRRI